MLIMLMNLRISANELDSLSKFELIPSNIQTDLVLPACIWNENNTICQRTKQDENIILEMYVAYNILMKHRGKIEDILTFNQKIFELGEQSLAIAEESIDDQAEYNKYLFEKIKECDSALTREKRRDIIKRIFLSIGAGMAGIGAGLLIGIIVE